MAPNSLVRIGHPSRDKKDLEILSLQSVLKSELLTEGRRGLHKPASR